MQNLAWQCCVRFNHNVNIISLATLLTSEQFLGSCPHTYNSKRSDLSQHPATVGKYEATVSLIICYLTSYGVTNKPKRKMTTAAVSAPGKVLLAGGYLVLDRAYQGLVFGLDARIHVCVQVPKTSDTDASQQKIVVRSPQFQKAHWVYSHIASKDGVRVTQSDE
jgi:hypothetical protein